MFNSKTGNRVIFTLTKFVPINGKGKQYGDITYGYRLCDDYGSLTVDHYDKDSKQCTALLKMSPQDIVNFIRKEHPEFVGRILASGGISINDSFHRIDSNGIIIAAEPKKRKVVALASCY